MGADRGSMRVDPNSMGAGHDSSLMGAGHGPMSVDPIHDSMRTDHGSSLKEAGRGSMRVDPSSIGTGCSMRAIHGPSLMNSMRAGDTSRVSETSSLKTMGAGPGSRQIMEAGPGSRLVGHDSMRV